MIRYEEVSKIYRGNNKILEDVNFNVDSGEFSFLIGPSGAGKTTLLKFLIREDTPTQGKVWFKDDDVVKLPGRKVPQLRRKIGMVFQDFKLLKEQTVEENVRFALEVTGHKSKEQHQVVSYLLERVGLATHAKMYPYQLSIGEQQRVAIARALVHEPQVLLADEPTGNLDIQNASNIIDLLKQINEWGTTVIVATHDLDLIKHVPKVKVFEIANLTVARKD